MMERKEAYMESRIIFAPDGLDGRQALDVVGKIGGRIYATKIHDLYDRHGRSIVESLKGAGSKRVWVDAKLKDIPRTVKDRAAAIAASGADILTVHTDGEIDMMMAARDGAPKMMILGVTVLTSLDEDQNHLLTGQPVKAAVLYRARLAKLAGLDGVVCSPQEVAMLANRRELVGLKFVTPGTRSAGKDVGDQKRVTTPLEALKAGATKLVIASQISGSVDPIAELDLIEAEISRYP
jgi:orotidine-5'-phosphate decarboxylase